MSQYMYLIPHCDPRNALPRFGLLNALQIALLEAQVRQRWHVLPPRNRMERTDRNLIFSQVGEGIGVGVRVEADGLLL